LKRSRSGRSALSSAITTLIERTAATATAGASGVEAVTTPIAAILPATGTGAALRGALSAVPAAATTATSVATATAITATTAALTARAAAAAVATTTAAAASTTGLSLVDAERATHHFDALQGLNRPGLAIGVSHLHKRETALPSRVPLQRQGTADDFAIRGKKLRHVFLLGAKRQVANKNTH
jgi:hypothetical protein